MANTRKGNGKPDPAAVIAAAKPAERTVEICLRGDLVAEVENLERQMRDHRTDRMVGNPQGHKLAQQVERLRADMRASTIVVRLRAMSRRDFQKFVAEHGPRDGNADDQATGINTDTYFDDLIKACAVEPDLSADQWDALLDACNTKQWDDLSAAAFQLNTQRVTVPFSAAASLLTPTSDATSKRHERGE